MSGGQLDAMAEALADADWYEFERASAGEAAVGVLEHGTRDPDANVVWREEGLVGVVYGVVSNRDRLSLSWGELFRGVVDDSREVLPNLDGPFALAVVDTRAGEVHLATDPAGSRPLYYATDDGIRFASELSPLLAGIDDPTLDGRAVGDLLLFGGVVEERTLVEEAASLPPATHLTFDGESVTTERYWEPAGPGLAPSGYPDRWLGDYRRALADVTTTARDPSLWFPGGADSRIAAATLAEQSPPVETLTPGGRAAGDEATAAEVADALDLPNRQVRSDPDRHVVDAVAEAVAATDAMVAWSTVDALPYVTGRLHDDADVLVNGDADLGLAPWAGALGADDSAASALYEHERVLPAEAVRGLLAADWDPLTAVDDAVAASVDGPPERTAVDAAGRIRAATTLRARAVHRRQVGTRTVASATLFDTAARMPARYRVGTRPLSAPVGDGAPPIRRAVVRRLDPDVARIAAGVGEDDSGRPAALRADGAGSGGDAYLRHYAGDARFQRFVDDLLEGAADRDALDADGVRGLHENLASGDLPSFTPVAALTGVELWARRHLDDGATPQRSVAER